MDYSDLDCLIFNGKYNVTFLNVDWEYIVNELLGRKSYELIAYFPAQSSRASIQAECDKWGCE